MKAAAVSSVFAVLAVAVAGSSLAAPKQPSPRPAERSSAGPHAGGATARRGAYLVTVGGCNDCHTPWKVGPNGPEPDMARMLSGHPETLSIQAAAKQAPPWNVAVSPTFTAWSGPWGVSFSANLTPEPETGLGKWTEQTFVEAMRTGRHLGRGRPILPPMPWQNVGKMTDEDLKALFAYLRTIPAIRNRVPTPIVPEGGPPPSASGAPAPGAGDTGSGATPPGR